MYGLKLISSRNVTKCKKAVSVNTNRTQQTAAKKLVLKDFRDHPVGEITKKPPKPPFIKNMFIGHYDPEFIYYPEVAETDRYMALEKILPSVQKFFANEVCSERIDKEGCISEDVMSNLKTLGLFGNSIPERFGGLGHSYTEWARILEEAGVHPSIFLLLMSHQSFGVNAIYRHGTEDQKIRYLPSLTSGDSIASFCAAEPESGMDYSSMKSFAELSGDGSYWTLNGLKTWVISAHEADVLIVAMPTETTPARAVHNNLLTTFIVEKSSQGVSVEDREKLSAAKGVSICKVKFNNVRVPTKNILGRIGKGFDVCTSITNTDAYLYGSLAAGFLKKLFNETVKHLISCRQYQQDIHSMNSVKKSVAGIAQRIYAVESMTYLTASILDTYEKPDVDLESVATKVYAIEAMKQSVRECLDLLGSRGISEDLPFVRMLHDSQTQPLFNLTVDFSDVYIAAIGLKFAGPFYQDFVSKMRNPLSFPVAAAKLFFDTQKNLKKHPKLSLKINQYVHPSLKEATNLLERSVLRFKFCVLLALSNDGMNIMENHIALKRLAELVMLNYAMTAVLGRASRSYCCGTQNADLEVTMAENFVKDAYNRVDTIVNEIIEGPIATTDSSTEKAADVLFKFKSYAVEHPVKRNIV